MTTYNDSVFEYIVKHESSNYIQYFPKNIRDKFYIYALKCGRIHIEKLPAHLLTESLIHEYLPILTNIEMSFTIHENESLDIIPSLIPKISQKILTKELIKFIIEYFPSQICYVNPQCLSVISSVNDDANEEREFMKKLYTIIINNQTKWSLKFIPTELRTKELCVRKIQEDGENFRHVPITRCEHDLYILLFEISFITSQNGNIHNKLLQRGYMIPKNSSIQYVYLYLLTLKYIWKTQIEQPKRNLMKIASFHQILYDTSDIMLDNFESIENYI